jgi:uncharacterized protein YndB with AHSA1/START domain
MATIAVTPDHDTITGDIHIQASPERVFEALTDPKQLMQWWGQADMYRAVAYEIDLRPGGRWVCKGKGVDGKEFQVKGEYIEVDPPRTLEYSWIADWSGDLKTIVHWDLSPHQGGTMVRIRHRGFAGQAEHAKNHSNGWTRVLGWMQAYLEKGETVESRKAR